MAFISAASSPETLVEKQGKYDGALRHGLRKARAKGTWDAAFSYKLSTAPQPSDYFYLRAVQADGAVAWTSPVWIGK